MSAPDASRNETGFHFIEELLAFRKADSPEIMETLRQSFGSPLAVFSSGMELLMNCGLRESDAMLLSRIPDLARCCETSKFPRLPHLPDLASASLYLRAHYYCLPVERFYLLCLDGTGRMIALPLLQEGTENGTIFSLRTLMRKVQQLHPDAVVLSHNHPGGTPQPSQDDISCTRAAIHALSTVGVPVLDHLILTREEAVSIRQNAFIPESTWLRQAPDFTLLKNWLGKSAP